LEKIAGLKVNILHISAKTPADDKMNRKACNFDVYFHGGKTNLLILIFFPFLLTKNLFLVFSYFTELKK